MKYSKANTITPPVFVKNTDLHKARIQALDDTHLAFVYGGNIYLPIDGVRLGPRNMLAQILDAFWGLIGLDNCGEFEWDFYPVTLLTNVLLTTGLVTTTVLLTKKITTSARSSPEQKTK